MISIITADERPTNRSGIKILILGVTGIGKTSLLRTIDPAEALFVDIDRGGLAVQDLQVDIVQVDDWPTARDLACRIGGPHPSYAPTQCYSEAHYNAVGGRLENLDRYKI